MQCRYREKLVYAGDMIFGTVYATYRKAGSRRGKFKETSETQAKNNERRSLEYLTWLIHENFDKTGFAVHPTYEDGYYPEDEVRFKKDMRNYMARLKRVYDKAGAELKYIVVYAFSDTGRLHFHVLVSGGVSREAVEDCWGLGRINADRLQFNECGIVDLSRYVFNQRSVGKRRWTGSRNLKKPVEKVNDHNYAAKDVRDIKESPQPHKFFADKYPGYWLSEFPHVEKNGVNGSYYMTFVMYKPNSNNLERYARRR